MARRYEIGREINLEKIELGIIDTKYFFFAKVCNSINEKIVGEFQDESLSGLAKKVSKKFPFIYPKEDEVRSISDKTIKRGIGRFPVLYKELTEFYSALNKVYPPKSEE